MLLVLQYRAVSSAWLERLPYKQEVAGSSPALPTILDILRSRPMGYNPLPHESLESASSHGKYILDARCSTLHNLSMSPMRSIFAVLATGCSISGVGIGMLISGWHPKIGVALITLGAGYLLYELFTCGPVVKAVPEGMLRFLAAFMTAAFALLIVGPDIERTLRLHTHVETPPLAASNTIVPQQRDTQPPDRKS